ncbi:TetR family transcriptional regulator C-terminal domain-containing protein [Kibdelosporangium philippinense]|uniref:TetR family transcriptional regulator C-terminal domain-containing protein n=1 Tax=Kibdelosporangium philippinense TaxID=211113 RepID=A0ABS8ZCB5_9PSEU|nr:TetR family transcriptional regulator C-terminal domain-containing protein [Kibdelosporangium philippinense]MCE7004824.1 TetR family transcriptional regulator C-terminal domain-containing protein [Kibdelosporangium philippinense]
MPRQVDHEQRRQAIAEALWRIVSTQGLEGVSLRNVAAEAGISMGLVQHYFRSKDEMLLFAYATLSVRIENRLLAGSGYQPTLKTLFLEMLPLDDERREEAHAVVAFMTRAAVSPAFAEAANVDAGAFRAYITSQLTAAGVPDAEQHTEILLATVDGMAVRILAGYLTPEQAVKALDTYLAALGCG